MQKKLETVIKGENVIAKKIISTMLIISLTFVNLILLGTVMGENLISYASQELEGQNINTQHANVKFDAYFSNNGNKTHTLTLDEKESSKLYFLLNVKEKGYLKNGYIELKSPNYTIYDKLEASEIMESIENNKIELKQINYGTEAIVDLPMSLKIENEFALENISKQSSIVLKGTYVTDQGEEVEIEKEIQLNVSWTSQKEIQVESNISKYKIYEENQKTLIQEEIKISKEEQTLPVIKTKIEVQVPEYKFQQPEKIVVQANTLGLTTRQQDEQIEFGKENWNYNEENKTITIEVENKENEGKVWSGNGQDIYTLTYIYKENEESIQDVVQRKAVITSYSYNGNTLEETVNTIEETTDLPEQTQEIITGEIQITNNNISKGNMYANTSSNNREYVTNYEIKQIIRVPYIEESKEIIIQSESDAFINETDKYSTKIGDINYTSYTKTLINKEHFDNLLGEEGYIIIENENGQEVGRINKDTTVEDEKYVITYDVKQDNIILKTSQPKQEGNLFIYHEKEIKADLPYSKNQIQIFKQLETNMIVGENEIVAQKALDETSTKVDMSINKQTITKKENIEIKLELNNTSDKSDLYTNPKFTIELPEYINNITIEKTELVFEEELKLKTAQVITTSENKKAIEIELMGTQTKYNTIPNTNGTTLIIQANVEATKTGEGKAVLKVENQNAINYATDSISEAVLNAYVPTYYNITVGNTSEENEDNEGENAQNTENNTTDNEQTNNNEQTTNTQQYLQMTVESNGRIYKAGDNYTYSIGLEDTTPEELKEELEWSEEDTIKVKELNERLTELSENEDITEQQALEIQNISDEIIEISLKYARGELKEYYGLDKLKETKKSTIDNKIEEYEKLIGLQEPLTEEQTKQLNELKELLKEYISAKEAFDKYQEELPDENNLTGEQEEKLDELRVKITKVYETLTSLEKTQEERLVELEKKMEDGTITEIDDTTITNIELKVYLPKYVTYKSAQLENLDGQIIQNKKIEYDSVNNLVILQLEKYPEDMGELQLNIETVIEDIGEDLSKEIEANINLQYEQLNSKIEQKNATKLTVGKIGIEVIKTTEGLKEKNQTSDEVTFKLQIKNIGLIDCYSTELTFELPEELNFEKISYETYGELIEDNAPTITDNKIEIPISSLLTNQTTYAYLTATVGKVTEDKNIQIQAVLNYKETQEEEFKSEKIQWGMLVEKTQENSENPSTPVNPNKEGTYSISGYAWEDSTSDGIKSESETIISGVKAILVNAKTNQTIETITTNQNGQYQFNNIEQGEYLIIFEYDSKEYILTEYKKTNEEEVNSNAIGVEDGKATTDVIKVTDQNIRNINIGLVKIPKFDMSLQKRVSKITVQNAEGTKTYSYNNVELAKVEINGKYINGTTVLVEYKIRVTNEGELAGTIEKIVDYMPQEMAFSSDLNNNWVQDSDGNLYNTELSKLNIEPGETKEITLILRKRMTEDNTGTINNRAEITQQTSNANNIQDYDSTPGNEVQGEDDISTADVIIGIKTGDIVLYIILTIVSLSLLGIGIYIINKKVIIKK